MAKTNLVYVCNNCGQEHNRWSGRCVACGEWNSLKEFHVSKEQSKKQWDAKPPIPLSKISIKNEQRIPTTMSEFDRVLGGGIVGGSVVLLGGDPGIGKSTLLLSAANEIANKHNVLYISGEESLSQIKMRATRLSAENESLLVLQETVLEQVIATILEIKPDLVVIDSVQTILSANLPSIPGSISQLKETTSRLIEIAKREGIPMVLIGHVTKDGGIAGPKVLEHLVDVVLYLEGTREDEFRVLKSVKNRFGATNEVGLFLMRGDGLVEVTNPSEMFIERDTKKVPGTSITASMEGNRIFLVELQALVSQTHFGYPKRSVSGFSLSRLNLLVAVLSKRLGFKLPVYDIYLNAVGGFRVREAAADFAASMAVASAFLNKALPSRSLFIGEVGLSGEIRNVRYMDKRIEEASKLGFDTIVVPKSAKLDKKENVLKVYNLKEAIDELLK